MFFVKADGHQKTRQMASLETQKRDGSVRFYQEIRNNSFLIVGEKPELETESYFSNIYRNTQNQIVIILPRIVIMLKDGGKIDPILITYKDKISIETGANSKYILQYISEPPETHFNNTLNTIPKYPQYIEELIKIHILRDVK